MRAVIADDEIWILPIIENALVEMEGNVCEVVGKAYDGISALAQCEALMPDLLITDIRMPGLTGLELIEKVNLLSPQTKTIIISGADEFAFARQAIGLGVSEYLLKPIYEEDLAHAVRKVKSMIDSGREDLVNVPKDNVTQAMLYIQEHYHEDIKLEQVAKRAFLNANYFSGLFKQRYGVNFSEYLTNLRMKKAEEMLRSGLRIYEISEKVGIKDPKYFTKLFYKHYGCMPNEYRSKYRSGAGQP